MAELSEREQALAELKALLRVPGALRIITNHPAPEGDRPEGATPYTPGYFVMHPVERLEGPDAKGQYRAYSAEYDLSEMGRREGRGRDVTVGYPEALIRRLQQWRTEAARR